MHKSECHHLPMIMITTQLIIDNMLIALVGWLGLNGIFSTNRVHHAT